VEFCPKCGSRLTAKSGVDVLLCPKCGYKKQVEKNDESSKSLKEKKMNI